MPKSPHDDNELFAPERPVRSDFARQNGLSYAVRRLISLAVLAGILIGGGVWLWRHVIATGPTEIPTIKSEGSYKQKPEQPGGIDIPHQDVQVYHEIDGSAAGENTKPALEHLLPPPEQPMAQAATKDAPDAAPKTEKLNTPKSLTESDPINYPPEKNVPSTVVTTTTQQGGTPPQSVAPTTTPSPMASPPPVRHETSVAETEKPAPAVKGGMVAQLAALPDEHAATEMAKKLQSKYQTVLGSSHLRVVRADLGTKGIFYRIQSQGMAESSAKTICAEVKKQNGGCILVHP